MVFQAAALNNTFARGSCLMAMLSQPYRSGPHEILCVVVTQIPNMVYADRRGEVVGQWFLRVLALSDEGCRQPAAQQGFAVSQNPRLIINHDIMLSGIVLENLLQVLLLVNIDQDTPFNRLGQVAIDDFLGLEILVAVRDDDCQAE